MSAAVAPSSMAVRSAGEPARMSIGCLSCSYSYGGGRQQNDAGPAARIASISATPVSTGRNARRSSDVDLAPAAAGLRKLLERRLEDGGTEVDARQSDGRSASPAKRSACTHGAPTSSNGRVVPRPSDAIVPSKSTVPG